MQTDQRITVAMAELLRRQGYAGTGIKQVIEAAGVPNGSLYHHFPGGKSEIAGVALRTMGAAYAELVGGLLADGDDLPAAIERAFDAAADDIESTGWVNMCPVGTIAGEVADAEPALREVAAEIFVSWIDGGTELVVGRGYATDDARGLVTALVAALEGAFVMARTLRSTEPLRGAGRAMAAYASSLPVGVRS
ncbi:TetR/AcrR family transcriptional regulator [Gordonia sp. SL306]|uniref:TetR/AcrR family transcriptional regulator n=1 Tax=Gordonia sp. SL306 TaxID=2995145 RepID=UPI0022718830|nr:TetR/AcrR family transcriptional regulator [Gordonia sp. SL306]WAC54335.1 TetR/AcrR family transcriptional regulator [Gordonia sp. SL306]